MKKKLSSHQVPVPEVSGLDFPAQITVDGMNNGCTQKMESKNFGIGPPIASHQPDPYMNEVSAPVA